MTFDWDVGGKLITRLRLMLLSSFSWSLEALISLWV